METASAKGFVGDLLHAFGEDEKPDRHAVGKPRTKRLGRYARQRNAVDAARQAQHKTRQGQARVARERMEVGRKQGVRLRLAPQGEDGIWSGEQCAFFSAEMERFVRIAV